MKNMRAGNKVLKAILIGFLFVRCSESPGITTETIDTRIEKWKEDLNFLSTQMPLRHVNLYHSMTPSAFQNAITALENNLTELTDNQIKVELMRIVALVSANGRDSHTSLDPTQPAMGFKALPVRLYQFADGMYVTAIQSTHSSHIGSRLVRIGSLPIEQILELAKLYIAKDNDYTFLDIAPFAVIIPEILHVLDITDNSDNADFVFADQSGGETTVNLQTISTNDFFTMFSDLDPTIFPQDTAPLYLSNLQENFWYHYLGDDKTLYFQYNDVFSQNTSGQSLTEFSDELAQVMATEEVSKLVIDLRNNHGGDRTTYAPLLEMIKANTINQPDNLFVVIGRSTQSAAINFTMEMENETQATFIGEPTGGSPDLYGDALPLILPNSRIEIGVSSIFHQDAVIDPSRLAKSPDILVELTSVDFFAGIDPVLDEILRR